MSDSDSTNSKSNSKKSKTKKTNESTPNNLTESEIKDYLKNSISIPKEQWETLPINSFISYIKEDGKFIKGGYVKLIFNKKNNIYLIYGTKIDKYNNDKYYKEFTINLSNIKEIYKKIDQSALLEYQIIKTNITKLIDNTNTKLEEIILRLSQNEKKIIKLEENHYKTLKLIKNLHNIKSLDNIK
jgi:hypothetical protein